MHKIFFILLSCLIQNSLYAMDPTSPRSAHPERAQRVEGRRDTNHAILSAEALAQEEAPEEQRRMDHPSSYLEKLTPLIPTGPDINATNNCGQTRLHLAVLLAQKENANAVLQACKSLVRQRANIALTNNDGQTPLYLAAVVNQSIPLTKILLTTCPSIKPALKTILLSCRRWGLTIPKDLLFNCIVPYIIFNETETKLAVVKTLITLVLESKGTWRPNPMAGRNVFVVTEKRLCNLVKTKELEKLLDPKNIKQLRAPIMQELYASINKPIAQTK